MVQNRRETSVVVIVVCLFLICFVFLLKGGIFIRQEQGEDICKHYGDLCSGPIFNV